MTLKPPNLAQRRDVSPPHRGITPTITNSATNHSIPCRQHPNPHTIPILQQPLTPLPK